jgi:hypothetical protein
MMRQLSSMNRGLLVYWGFSPHNGHSILLLRLPVDNYKDDPRLRNYAEDEQEFKVVIASSAVLSKFTLFAEAIEWINVSVEVPWSVRAEGSQTIFQFSFADLQIATLFRLRF